MKNQLNFVCLLTTASTTTLQATPTLMIDMFTTTTQAFTAISTSGLVDGKLQLKSVSFIELLSCYDLHEHIVYTQNSAATLVCF